MPSARQHAIERFFAAYAQRFNDSLKEKPVVDAAGVRNSFAPYFVEASPVGVQGGKNGLMFRMMIPRGFAHYKKIGTTAMNVTSLEVTDIDDMHVMARVGWDSRYRKDGKEIRIPFTNVYLLQVTDEGPKIFAYITGDEQKVMKEHGLI
jgi:hypothetical protein